MPEAACDFCGGDPVVSVARQWVCERCWSLLGLVVEALALTPQLAGMVAQSVELAGLPEVGVDA
jgi:hypothetical protein